MGISVVRSYQSAKLFSALGLGSDVIEEFFPGIQSPIGGLNLDQIAEMVLERTNFISDENLKEFKPIKSFQYKEHARGTMGEKHSMTNTRSKMIHDLAQKNGLDLDDWALYDEYIKLGIIDEPVGLRHLFSAKSLKESIHLDEVKDASHILETFGSGAMSLEQLALKLNEIFFLPCAK